MDLNDGFDNETFYQLLVERKDDIQDFQRSLNEMYCLCDCLQAADTEELSDRVPLTVRDVLKRELIRMGTYLVMYELDCALPGGVKIINELLDADLNEEEMELLDVRNRQNAAYVYIPLDIQIAVRDDAENRILRLFERFGQITAAFCEEDKRKRHAMVYDYLYNLEDCFTRIAYGKRRMFREKPEYDLLADLFAELEDDLLEDEEDLIKDEVDASDPDEIIDEPPLEEILQELDSLIGLANVKAEVRTMANLVRIRKIRENRGLGQAERSLHMVFSGNPGTGKTTVARLVAQIYRSLGVLSRGHLVETDRSGLVAGYVGQTAIKTAEVIKRAMGGVLFIDEAYALAKKGSESDYGQEAIETLLKAMEDNRGDLIVIAAGYTDLREDFLNSNPGLRSRFSKTLFFEDYDGAQLHEIFCKMCRDSGMTVTEEADERMRTYFHALYENRGANFANARDVRNAFEKILAGQANRLASVADADLTDEMLMEIRAEDAAFV